MCKHTSVGGEDSETVMILLWTLMTVFCSPVSGSEWTYRTESACYSPSECGKMKLDCNPNRHIFILRMQYGYKSPNSSCIKSSSCDKCCQPEDSDCFSNYTEDHFGLVYASDRCWHQKICESEAWRTEGTCSRNTETSTFAVVDYSCLERKEITAFHDNTTIIAPAVAVHYDSARVTSYPVLRGDNQTWFCQVDMVDLADGVQHKADVILVKESYMTYGMSRCSSVGWSGGSFLPCDSKFRYTSFNTSTPFRITLIVNKHHREPNGWTVIRAQQGSSLVVTCGFTHDHSSVTTPSPDMTSRSTPSQSSEVNTGSEASRSNNTGAVIGGAVAAVVVLVVAAFLGVLYYRRWRSRPELKAGSRSRDLRTSSLHLPQTSNYPESLAATPTQNSRASDGLCHMTGVCNPAIQSDVSDADNRVYYTIQEEIPGLQNDYDAASGVHGNGRRPSQDLDYDKLGEKKTQNSKPAATYGRLGEVGGGVEDTDYSYDHLARGPQSAPDVINSDYDTAALHVTSEGDYNVAFFPEGKQLVITGSDYDVAAFGTPDPRNNNE